MQKKIFVGVLIAATLISAFFAFYAHLWLQSIGEPAAALNGFLYNSTIGWRIVLFSSLILLIVGNIELWKSGTAWAIWTTFLFFSLFAIAWGFWLEPEARQFAVENRVESPVSWLTPLSAAIFCLAAAAAAYADHFVVIRLAERMFARSDEPVAELDRPVADIDEPIDDVIDDKSEE